MTALEQMFSLQGHLALVTGSSRGIGRSIALAFAHAGARLILHGSKPSPRLDEALAEVRATGADATAVTCDLTDEAALRSMLGALPELPDILVLNASTQKYMTVEHFETAEFDATFAANVRASTILCQAVLPRMVEQRWGRIIAIGSVNEWKQAPRLFTYAASKCAQTGMILSLARSHAQYGITANSIAPGVIATDRNAVTLSNPDVVKMLLEGIPSRRFGEPDDIAGTAVLLASNAGSYINGANIPVTGGMHL